MYEGTKHSVATELVERGVDLRIVQRFLGPVASRPPTLIGRRLKFVAVLRPTRDS